MTYAFGSAVASGVGRVARAVNFTNKVRVNSSVISIPKAPKTNIIIRNNLSNHSEIRLNERGITKPMINKTIEIGVKYYDRKNGTYSYVLDKGMASGKTLQVAVSPQTGEIVTVINGRGINKNTISSDGGLRWIEVK